jgi:acetyltransferase-like isoleucine patch superfamily enzyme
MNRFDLLDNKKPELKELFAQISQLYLTLGEGFLTTLSRLPSMPDLFVDRWEKARLLGFGEGSNIYDNSLVLGDVQVGRECWIGPDTILDGSGGLTIGDFCTISAGVHLYTHDNVKQTLSSKQLPIEKKQTSIGSNVYIGPHAVVTKGVKIGNRVIIGTFAFVNKDVTDHSIVMGQPAKKVGEIITNADGEIVYKYF